MIEDIENASAQGDSKPDTQERLPVSDALDGVPHDRSCEEQAEPIEGHEERSGGATLPSPVSASRQG